MKHTFYFYDLETSGVSPKSARVMQFAGQRTDLDLRPIGEPHNILIKLTEDILPEPEAILVTGITPQKTLAEGVTEADFLRIFHAEIATSGTIFTGFNSVRFDDEFMRYMHYRNFYDPYEWQWKSDRSRWDLLDVVRMTRALRPDGIEWPFDSKGKPTNRLEYLTSVNGLSHENAHDALSDVWATIDLAKLIKEKQPKLFSYLLELRDKKKVKELVDTNEVFLYSSGKYSTDSQKTTMVTKIADTPDGAALVYDLRIDPSEYLQLDETEIIKWWQKPWDDPGLRFPVKTLKYNRCPAVAPLGVLDKESQERLGLKPAQAARHSQKLAASDFGSKTLAALKRMNAVRQQQQGLLDDETQVDGRLYDGFIPPQDKPLLQQVQAADGEQLSEVTATMFHDERLRGLLPLYKARNYQELMTSEEREEWERHRSDVLLGGGEKSRLAKFAKRLQQLSETEKDSQKRYLLEELQLYAESIMPEID